MKCNGLPSALSLILFATTLVALPARDAIADVYLTRSTDGTPYFTDAPVGKASRLIASRSHALLSHSQPTDENDSVARWQPIVNNIADRYGIDPALVRALIDVESHFNPNARSQKGAAGMMQLMPETAARYGVRDAFDAYQNIDAGARHLKSLIDAYRGNVVLALSAYNAGQRAVSSHRKRIPPYPETMLYVPKVLARYESYRSTSLHGTAPNE